MYIYYVNMYVHNFHAISLKFKAVNNHTKFPDNPPKTPTPATNDNDLIDRLVPRLTSSSRGINRSKRRSTGVEERSRSADWSKGGPQPGGPSTSSSFRPGILEARYPELPPPSLAAAFASSIGSRKGAAAECQGRNRADG